MEQILSKKNKFINGTANVFNSELVELEKSLFKSIDKSFLKKFGKDISLVERAQIIAEIENKINTILKRSDYKKSVDKFLKSFDKINDFNKTLHKSVNGIGLGKIALRDIEKAQILVTRANLLGGGISSKFSEPIKEVLRRNIVSGVDIQSAKEAIENLIVGVDKDGLLQRYAGQVANDTLRQYDGMINQQVKDKYQMTSIRYVGSIKDTSRGQCRHWVSFDVITDEQLADEIPIAVSGGSLGGYQCNGMIEDTTIDNFNVNRGGYNCRHESIPVYE